MNLHINPLTHTTMSFDALWAPRVIVSDLLAGKPSRVIITQVQFPRSHRKRVRRKWAKQPRRWAVTGWTEAVPEQGPFRVGDDIICGPVAYARLIAASKETA